MSRADRVEREVHEAARLRHFNETGELKPRPFQHIDWCDSEGPYLAADCSCPCDCGTEQGVEVFCSAHQPQEETYFVDESGEYGPTRPGL